MHSTLDAIFLAVTSASVAAAIVGIISQRYVSSVQQQIKLRFDGLMAISSSQRAWNEHSIAELLGPVNMQIDRTQRAFQRWTTGNLYLEAKVIREGNQCIRDLLLTNGHYTPADLLEDAGLLIEHYDRWLEEFERIRGGRELDLKESFVFVGIGPNPIPFPRRSADRFQTRFRELWMELYGST